MQTALNQISFVLVISSVIFLSASTDSFSDNDIRLPGLVDGPMPKITSLDQSGQFAPKMHVGPDNQYLDYFNHDYSFCEIHQPDLAFLNGFHTDDTHWRVVDLKKHWVQPNPAHTIDYIGLDHKEHTLWVAIDTDLLGIHDPKAHFEMDQGYKTDHVDFIGFGGHLYTATIKVTDYYTATPESDANGDPTAGKRQRFARFRFDVAPYHN